jgi:ATP synthase protein I
VADPEDRNSFAEAMRQVAPYLNLGLTFAVTVGMGVAGGWWLDRWLNTSPYLLLAGILVGLVAAFVGFLRTVLPGKGEDGRR